MTYKRTKKINLALQKGNETTFNLSCHVQLAVITQKLLMHSVLWQLFCFFSILNILNKKYSTNYHKKIKAISLFYISTINRAITPTKQWRVKREVKATRNADDKRSQHDLIKQYKIPLLGVWKTTTEDKEPWSTINDAVLFKNGAFAYYFFLFDFITPICFPIFIHVDLTVDSMNI